MALDKGSGVKCMSFLNTTLYIWPLEMSFVV